MKNEKVVKKKKNEEVAQGRIIGLAGPCLFIMSRDRTKLFNSYFTSFALYTGVSTGESTMR